MTTSRFLRFILVLLFLCFPRVQSANSRRRVVTVTKKAPRYDQSVTTFDPTGRLLQVEYGMEASKRGESVVSCLLADESIVVIISSSASQLRSNKVHRLDHHLWLFTSGLVGDARILANHLQVSAQKHSLSFGEPMTVEEAAEEAASLQHAITRIEGARPLGCSNLVVGRDPLVNRVGAPKLYRTDPGGGMIQGNFGCIGKDQERLFGILQEKYDSIRDSSVSSAIKQLTNIVLDGKDRNSKCVEVWLLRRDANRRGKTQAICFSNVSGSSASIKEISDHLASFTESSG